MDDGLAVGHRGGQRLEEADVVVGHEHVDEPAQAALVVEDALGEARVGGLQRGEDLADGGAVDGDLGLARR